MGDDTDSPIASVDTDNIKNDKTRSPGVDGNELSDETQQHLEVTRSWLPSDLDHCHIGLGFDGFIDRVKETIKERTDGTYRPHHSLQALGEEIVASAEVESSLTIEWTTTNMRTGGHTAHIGRAYDHLGFDVTAVGTFGQPVEDAYKEEFHNQTLVSIADPGYTDAVELGELKLMLSDTGIQRELDWNMLVDRVGLEKLAKHLDGVDMLGTGYWAIINSMPTIWDGLRTDLFPIMNDLPEFLLVDPFDVRQLPETDIRSGAGSLEALDNVVPITVCANKVEIFAIADAYYEANASHEMSFAQAAEFIRDRFGVTEVAGHAIDNGVYATESGICTIESPRTTDPVTTTSAGDHFAAGIALAKHQGSAEGPALVLASAVAGWFVRNGGPPSYQDIQDFIKSYEWFFGAPER